MADLSTGTSGYGTGSTDTWTSQVNNVSPYRAEHCNGLASAILQIETALGSGATLPGSFASLAARLAVQVPANGVIIPSGVIWEFAGSSSPSGWLFCDGSAVSRTAFSDLFAAIGTTWGVGDGSTTFNLPDKRGRVTVGAGTGARDGESGTGAISGGTALTARALGSWFGKQAEILDSTMIPAHVHPYATDQAGSAGFGRALGSNNSFNGGLANTETNTGGGGAHNNLQPSLVMNYIIKT